MILLEEIEAKTYNNAIKIIKKLKEAGFRETYIVGGWVRDRLLNLDTAKDIDIATSATPAQIKEVLKGEKFIEVGESFNIVMVIIDGEQFEIATFRQDIGGKDGRRPEKVILSNPENDAKRRDFSINAIFFDPIENKYIDFVGGKQDLEQKLLRAIGNPDKRFEEDYLRLLRAIRFSAQKGFGIEAKTYSAIKNAAHGIAKISRERIKAEIDKILSSSTPGKYIEMMDDTTLLKKIYPSIYPIDLNKLSTELDLSKNYIDLRWAILLFNAKDNIETVMRENKFENKIIKRIKWLYSVYESSKKIDNISKLEKLKIVFDEDYKILKDFLIAKETVEENGILGRLESFREENKNDSFIINQVNNFDIVNGNDLKNPPFSLKGPIIGEILNDVKNKFVNKEIQDKKQALDYIRDNYIQKESLFFYLDKHKIID